MSTGLGWYLDTIGRVPLLTPAEEIELGTAIRAWLDHENGPDQCPAAIKRRGKRARERFVNANLRFAVSYVNKHCNRLAKRHSRDDLVQAANEGLIRAVERFDPTRGYRFTTMAYWWIKQSVNRYVDIYGRSVTIPGSHSQYLYRLSAIRSRLQSELGRDPTRQELADELGVSLAVLNDVITNGKAISSIDSVVDDDEHTLAETLPSWDRTPEEDEELQERWKQAEQLRNLIRSLPKDDQRILSLAWGLDGQEMPRPELAKQEGITTIALRNKLRGLEAELRYKSVQLVLIAVAHIIIPQPPRKKRRRNRRRDWLQLALSL